MATTYTSKKLSYNSAQQFKESFAEPNPSIGYLFIGNHLPWTNEDSPDAIQDDVSDEKSIWDKMFAARRITGNDVELVIPRYNWAANTIYRHYDDNVTLENLVTPNVNVSISGIGFYEDPDDYGNSPMYVINSERNVYICLDNAENANSSIEPTGKNLSSNGNIQTADGYIWKYLYNVRASNKFLTTEWMPVPDSTSKLDYDTSPLISVDGEIVYLEIMETGSGYVHSEITVQPFKTGTNVITVANTNNLALDMTVAGTGLGAGSYITAIDTLNLKVTLSANTSANGGGSGNTVSVTTRVVVDGDGTGVVPVASLSNTGISDINLTSYGKDYSRANVTVYGTGSGAYIRAVIPPKFGHGFNSAKELGASDVMVALKIGEIDTSEGGIISSNTTFRQYGLLVDPHKYGSNTVINSANANSVISQTTNIQVLSVGSSYNTDELVYQGPSIDEATFSGYVNNQSDTIIRLTNVVGTPLKGGPLKGTSTNPTGRAVVTWTDPEFEPHAGDILYVNNITKTQRTEGQAESIKFVVRF